MKNKLVEITNPYEMERFIKENKYLLVDDGINEYCIREIDLTDYLYNRNESVNVYKPDGEFLLSTFGFFLNRISYIERQKIIQRLIQLQQGLIEPKETPYCDSTILQYIQD